MQFCRFSLNSPIQFRFCKPLLINVMKNPRQPSLNVKMLIWLPFPVLTPEFGIPYWSGFQWQFYNRMATHFGGAACVRKHNNESKNQRKIVWLRPCITNLLLPKAITHSDLWNSRYTPVLKVFNYSRYLQHGDRIPGLHGNLIPQENCSMGPFLCFYVIL